MGRIEDRLVELGRELPPPPQPLATYVPVVLSGSLAFVSGQTPMSSGAPLFTGHVGAEVTVGQAREAAGQCALQALSALREALGDLERIRRIVSVTVFVASAPGFTEQPLVANGASDLLVEILADAGRHSRAAIGVSELPLGVPVEVSLIAEIVA
ncbi:MAG: RidA family protein [Actinomycetota bacterium]